MVFFLKNTQCSIVLSLCCVLSLWGLEAEYLQHKAVAASLAPHAFWAEQGASPAPVLESAPAQEQNTAPVYDPAWEPLLARLEADGLAREYTQPMFALLGAKSYTPAFMATKVLELHGIPGIALPRPSLPAPVLPTGYTPPIAQVTLKSCKEFVVDNQEHFRLIQDKYGVSAPVILAILLIETDFGHNLGQDTAFRVLSSMAMTTTPALLASQGNTRQVQRVSAAALAATLQAKSEWAYNELRALLEYANKQGSHVAFWPSSFYGAMGLCQFMPSNIEPYGVDGDGDGQINLFSAVDAIYSVASYFAGHGWREGASADARTAVIREYNDDALYAAQVLAGANQLTLTLAGKGKMAAGQHPLAGLWAGSGRRFDPSLRRLRPVPVHARIKSLDSYQELLR